MTDHGFRAIDPREIEDNLFKLIADDWALITAGKEDDFNTMTVSWGTFGELWNKKICIAYVRPTRYTYDFTETDDHFTLSFFSERYRDALNYCGTKSGRDVDKVKETGLTPVVADSGTIYFAEASLVLVCRKIYVHDIDPGRFLDPDIEKHYSKKDYHRAYIGEIVQCLRKDA